MRFSLCLTKSAITVLVSFLTLTFVQCQKEFPFDTVEGYEGSIVFHAGEEHRIGTKATPSDTSAVFGVKGMEDIHILVNAEPMAASPKTRSFVWDHLSDLSSESIGLCIYSFENETDPFSEKVLFSDGTYSLGYHSSSARWKPAEDIFWPCVGGWLEFLSWVPEAALSVSAVDGVSSTVSYTVPDDVDDQVDLLVGEPVISYDMPMSVAQRTVELPFRHVLAAVRFRIESGSTLSNIEVSGMCDTGVLSLENGTFSSLSSSGNTVSVAAPSFHTYGGYRVTDDDYTLFFIPQTFSSSVLLEADLDGESLEAPLEGMTLQAGNIYTLTVRKSTYVLEVDKSAISYSYTGASVAANNFTVTSSKVSGSSTVPAPWRTEVLVGSAWQPLEDAVLLSDYAWLSGLPAGQDTPSTTATTVAESIPARVVTSHEDNLKAGFVRAVGGASAVDNSYEANAVDLSRYDFVSRQMEAARYTANCYVISSPGWYKFPLVYGNAIENDATVSLSYDPTSIGLGHLDSFKNYKFDLGISDPWIENDWKVWLVSTNVVSTVRVLWEKYSYYDAGTDSEVSVSASEGSPSLGVVDVCKLASESDGRYVVFHVSSENIKQGNFLITALDAGGNSEDELGEIGALVMWSWHVWITDQPMAEVSVSNGSDTYGVLPVNVGWVDGSKGLYYAPRTAQLRFRSTEAPTIFSQTMTVTQEAFYATSTTGWGPYYQWGRKDPFVPGLFTFRDNYDVTMRGAIRHPEMFNNERSTYGLNNYYYDWSTNNYDNLWDSQWNDYGVTGSALPNHKTVTDPSPRRFCVPPDEAWNGFSSYGHSGGFNGGYHYYTNNSRTGTIFFPATGYITYSGVLSSATDSRYWTLHAWASMQRRASYGLRFTDSATTNCYYTDNHRASGESIRPVRFN